MNRRVIFSSSQTCNVQAQSGVQPVAIGIYFFGRKRGKPQSISSLLAQQKHRFS